jgi:hypothetical protein
MNKKWKQFVNEGVELLKILLCMLLFILLCFPLLLLGMSMLMTGHLDQHWVDMFIRGCKYAIFLITPIVAIFLLKLISRSSTWLFKILKISILLKSDVVVLPATKTYAIPLRMVGRSKIRLLIPELLDSYVNYKQENFSPGNVSLIKRKSTHHKTSAIRQISGIAKELVDKIQTQQVDLGDRLDELTRLEKLATSSEIYGEQAKLYSRAKLQIWNLLQSNYQLEKECEQFIREVLIGGELANYDLNNIPDVLDVKIRLDSRCKQVAAEYEHLKLEMQAYNILKSSM